MTVFTLLSCTRLLFRWPVTQFCFYFVQLWSSLGQINDHRAKKWKKKRADSSQSTHDPSQSLLLQPSLSSLATPTHAPRTINYLTRNEQEEYHTNTLIKLRANYLSPAKENTHLPHHRYLHENCTDCCAPLCLRIHIFTGVLSRVGLEAEEISTWPSPLTLLCERGCGLPWLVA